MDADGIAGLVDFLDHIRVADDILAGQEEGSMDVFLFQDIQDARRILIVRAVVKGQVDDVAHYRNNYNRIYSESINTEKQMWGDNS